MSKTTVLSAANEAVKLWSEELFRDMIIDPFFAKMMGGSSAIVHTKEDFMAKKGDRLRFAIRNRLTGAGVTNGETLRGKEESLVTSTSDLTLNEYRHAVSYDSLLSDQRAQYSLPEETRMAIKDWAVEKLDELCFDAITASPSKIVYSGSATSTATVSDKLTPSLISKLRAIAKTGDNRSFTPIRPVKVDGGEYYVLLVHPHQAYDLKVDTTWTQAQREAQNRGDKNNIFTGALGIWDNVIVKESERVPVTTTWGAGGATAGAKSVLLGQQALVAGYGMRPKIVEDEFDYGLEKGVAIQMIFGVAKPVFNSKDYGSMAVYTARTAL